MSRDIRTETGIIHVTEECACSKSVVLEERGIERRNSIHLYNIILYITSYHT